MEIERAVGEGATRNDAMCSVSRHVSRHFNFFSAAQQTEPEHVWCKNKGSIVLDLTTARGPLVTKTGPTHFRRIIWLSANFSLTRSSIFAQQQPIFILQKTQQEIIK